MKKVRRTSKQNQILKQYIDLYKQHKRSPTRRELLHNGITRDAVRYYFGSLQDLHNAAHRMEPKVIPSARSSAPITAEQIIEIYRKLMRTFRRFPTFNELSRYNITKNSIIRHFGSIQQLQHLISKHFPSSFQDTLDYLYSPQKQQQVSQLIKKYKRFVVTTAVLGAKVHRQFYASIKKYCRKNNALLLVLLASSRSRAGSFLLDPILFDECIVTTDTPLNDNIFLSAIKLNAKQIDPIQGLHRIGQYNNAFIYASPKQRLKMVATSNVKIPRALMTTGAITRPYYPSFSEVYDRTSYLAKYDHVMGAIIVEIEDRRYYHFRQVQADKDGSFIDLGKRYSAKTITTEIPEAFVLGDEHAGETDPKAVRTWLSVIRQLHPKRIILHDVFSGYSINPHESDKDVYRALKAKQHKLSLESELRKVAVAINRYSAPNREVVIVASNHHDFLERWLESSSFVKDPINYKIGIELAYYLLNGHNPLAMAVERIGLKYPKKVRWLDRDEDYKIAKIECGAHGDKGINGSRGTIKTMEAAYGQSVSGHSHSVEILRGAWSVGTSTYLKLNYNKGPSSWTQSSCLIYANGSRQIINCINGRWRLLE